MLVLDEADQMVDERGMMDQSIKIKQLLPQSTQILLFSATFSMGVEKTTDIFVPHPRVSIRLKREQLSVDKIRQFSIKCESDANKALILSDLYSYISIGQSIVFVQRIQSAQDLAKKMREDGHSVSLLYGRDMSSDQRNAEISAFRAGQTKVLITTNVLARGIDILQVSLVVNFDVPVDQDNHPDPVLYLHRVGRVGRFGRSGIAISFLSNDSDERKLNAISKHLGKEIQELKREDIETLDEILKGLKDLTPLRPTK
eukprot:gene18945-22671_t